MRRGAAALLVAGLLIGAGYTVGFGATDGDSTEPAVSDADGIVEIHHLDVGTGDATLIVTPSEETILIDSGHWEDEGEPVIDYLDNESIDRIDHLVATHGHDAYIGGHAAVIEQFETDGDGVGTAYGPGVTHASDPYDEYTETLAVHNVTLLELSEGDELSIDDEAVTVTALNPPTEPADRAGDPQYNSIVLTVEYGDVRYLTTGGTEGDVEQRLIEQWADDLDADIYQAGTHGSSVASTDPFLDAVDPEIAIISSAADSRYGYPHDEVLDSFANRSIETYWTGVHGDVVGRTDGTAVSVTSDESASTDPDGVRERRHDFQNESTDTERYP